MSKSHTKAIANLGGQSLNEYNVTTSVGGHGLKKTASPFKGRHADAHPTSALNAPLLLHEGGPSPMHQMKGLTKLECINAASPPIADMSAVPHSRQVFGVTL